MPKRASNDSAHASKTDLTELADTLRKRCQEEPEHPCAPRWKSDLNRFDAMAVLGIRQKTNKTLH